MAVTQAKPGAHSMEIDKKWLLRKFAETPRENAPDPNVTIEQLHAMMLTDGIRPEDNSFSRDILRARYPEDVETEELMLRKLPANE